MGKGDTELQYRVRYRYKGLHEDLFTGPYTTEQKAWDEFRLYNTQIPVTAMLQMKDCDNQWVDVYG